MITEQTGCQSKTGTLLIKKDFEYYNSKSFFLSYAQKMREESMNVIFNVLASVFLLFSTQSFTMQHISAIKEKIMHSEFTQGMVYNFKGDSGIAIQKLSICIAFLFWVNVFSYYCTPRLIDMFIKPASVYVFKEAIIEIAFEGLQAKHEHQSRCNQRIRENIKNNNITAVEKDILEGVDIHIYDHQTPLWHALYYEHFKIADLLKTKGACINQQFTDGQTLLHVFANNQTPSMKAIEWLLQNGAQIEATDENGRTPLHKTIASNIAYTQLLCKHGANVNAKDNYECTPLNTIPYYWEPNESTKNRALQTAVILLSYGATINTQSNLRDTPLETAIQNDIPDLVAYLLAEGADKKYSGLQYRSLLNALRSPKILELLDSTQRPSIPDSVRNMLLERTGKKQKNVALFLQRRELGKNNRK